MKKILSYNEFEDENDYIEYLEQNGLITHGCSLCMTEYGVCEKAVDKFKEDVFIVDIPFSHIDAQEFPVSCLVEWYGNEYVEEIKSRMN